jgi:3-hydroxyisobutyrate dehydrogenase
MHLVLPKNIKDEKMKKIGFIGLGIMGGGMAANLVKKGYELTVWNRDRKKTGPLVALGAKVADSPATLAAEVEVVVSMLRDDQVVRQLILEEALPAAHPGTTFIDLSTITPGMCRLLEQHASEQGCHFLDAPVTGSKAAAAAGQLNIMVGGSAAVLEAQRDVLEAMSQKITHVGPNGSSAFLKLANNQLAAVMMAALGESLSIIEQTEVDRNLALEIFIGTFARVGGLKLDKIKEKDWSTEFALDLMFKDMTQALQAADEVGVPVPVLGVARESLQRVRQSGKGSLDFSVVADPS